MYEKVVSLKKELGSGRAKEATKLIGKVKYARPRSAIVIDLDKSQWKLPGKDTSTFAFCIKSFVPTRHTALIVE